MLSCRDAWASVKGTPTEECYEKYVTKLIEVSIYPLLLLRCLANFAQKILRKADTKESKDHIDEIEAAS